MKYVGNLTESEKEVISCLFEKRVALENLFKIMTDSSLSELVEKMKLDYENVWKEYNQWWDQTAKKYGWESAENGYWSINFESNDVFLCVSEDI